MSAHIPPCDVETNGGDCCCAAVWMDRAKVAQLAAAYAGNDLLAMGLLCGQREDEYPRQAIERRIAELDTIKRAFCDIRGDVVDDLKTVAPGAYAALHAVLGTARTETK